MRRLLKSALLTGPLVLLVDHELYSVSNFYLGRVSSNDMQPIFNPLFEVSHSFIEDDYVLVKVIGNDYDPKTIKEKIVRILQPDRTYEFRKVACIEGEWCPTFAGFTFVQSGHAWVHNQHSEGYSVRYK